MIVVSISVWEHQDSNRPIPLYDRNACRRFEPVQ